MKEIFFWFEEQTKPALFQLLGISKEQKTSSRVVICFEDFNIMIETVNIENRIQ